MPTSGSSCGIKLRATSVTSIPNAVQNEVNAQPMMLPPPMTTDSGSDSSQSASLLVPAPLRSLCSAAILTRWFYTCPVAVEVRFQEPEPFIDPTRDIGVDRRTPRILDLRSVRNICP